MSLVLVVHVHFGVGTALARRLSALGTVRLAAPGAALGALGDCDAVVLCPYLTEGERDGMVAACARPRLPVLALTDEPGAGGVELVAGEQGAWTRALLAALRPSGSRRATRFPV